MYVASHHSIMDKKKYICLKNQLYHNEDSSLDKRKLTYTKNIDPCQSTQTAQADMGIDWHEYIAFVDILYPLVREDSTSYFWILCLNVKVYDIKNHNHKIQSYPHLIKDTICWNGRTKVWHISSGSYTNL